MATLFARTAVSACRRNVLFSVPRMAGSGTTMGDPLEHATGLEKRELLAHAAGNDNPFDLRVIKRNAGTKECPNEIPSAFESRLVGCICEDDATAINWMWLHKGAPRRCECGHWFKIIQKAPV